MTAAGFDNRIVSYETIHKIQDGDYKKLVEAVDAQPGDDILDGCCGYGEVTRRILDSGNSKSEFYLLDESSVQLDRAKSNLPEIPAEKFIQSGILETPFNDGFFDKVVIKMGVHEVNKVNQSVLFKEMYRILKPGGLFIIWELALDQDTQETFQKIIRKKDELAGFEEMVANRYFPRLDELHALYQAAGFKKIVDFHEIRYQPSTKARAEELVSKDRKEASENLKNDLTVEKRLQELGKMRVEQLTQYAREIFPEHLKSKMNFKDNGDDISFEVRKMIIRGQKMKLFLSSAFSIVASKLLEILPAKLENLKVVFIPTAANIYPERPWVDLDRAKLVEMGFQVEDLDLEKESKNSLEQKLGAVDIIFAAGGNVAYLMEKSRESGFVKILKSLVNTDKIYVGSSAGSIIVGPTIEPFKEEDLTELPAGFVITSTEGVSLTDLVILPHDNYEAFHKVHVEIQAKYGDKYNLRLLKDNQAILVEDTSEQLFEI